MVHVAIACDHIYTKMTKMCIYDIIIRKNKDTELTFYVLGNNLKEQVKEFEIFNKIPGVKVIVINMDGDKLIHRDISNNWMTHPRITKTTYFRFMIPTLPQCAEAKRVLYIDSDMLCRKDITALFNTPFEQPLAMVRDSYFIRNPDYEKEMKSLHYGWNAGLILMDLQKLRELNFTKICMDRANNIPHNDQAIINDTFGGNVYSLPPTAQLIIHHIAVHFPRMNDINCWNEFHSTTYQSIDEMVSQAVFYHLLGRKDRQLAIPFLKTIWDEWEERLHRFEETKVVEWATQEMDERIETIFATEIKKQA